MIDGEKRQTFLLDICLHVFLLVFCIFTYLTFFFFEKIVSVISRFKELQQQLPCNKPGAVLVCGGVFFSFY